MIFIFFSAGYSDVKKEKSNVTLEGAWELVSGEWNFDGQTNVFPQDTFQDLKSYKFYSKSHWAVLGQIHSDTMHWAHGGTYNIDGPNYVEYFEIAENPGMIGDSAVFEINLTENEMKLSNEDYNETWKRID